MLLTGRQNPSNSNSKCSYAPYIAMFSLSLFGVLAWFGYGLLVISKETVGNSWDVLNAILGHRYHQNHSESYLANESNICNKSEFGYSL